MPPIDSACDAMLMKLRMSLLVWSSVVAFVLAMVWPLLLNIKAFLVSGLMILNSSMIVWRTSE
jgi:hypothetical protein